MMRIKPRGNHVATTPCLRSLQTATAPQKFPPNSFQKYPIDGCLGIAGGQKQPFMLEYVTVPRVFYPTEVHFQPSRPPLGSDETLIKYQHAAPGADVSVGDDRIYLDYGWCSATTVDTFTKVGGNAKYNRARGGIPSPHHQGVLAASRTLFFRHVPLQNTPTLLSQQHPPPSTGLQPTIDRAQENITTLQNTVDAALGDVAELKLIVKCLKMSIAKNQNLTEDEYKALEKGADARINLGYVRATTTLKLFTKEEAEAKIEKAEAKIEKAEAKIKEAKMEIEKAEAKIKEAKMEIKEAEAKIEIANQAGRGGTLFVFDPLLTSKKRICVGEGVEVLKKLLGRERGLQQIKEGYAVLAGVRGRVGDKKRFPLIACAASSGTGKTEILKHIHNNHGHYGGDADNQEADAVLKLINENSLAGTKPLEKIITLFCSFNQNSTYSDWEEKIIVNTTTERLIRSYQGNVVFAESQTMNLRDTFDSLLARIPVEVGVIVCVDEIAKLSEYARRAVLDHLMTACQTRTGVDGGFCAIVGTALEFQGTWGKTVFSGSNRVIHPFTLLPSPDDVDLLNAMTEKLKSISGLGTENCDIYTAARILSQVPKPEEWVCYLYPLLRPGQHTLSAPSMKTIVVANADDCMIFEWLAPAILGRDPVSLRYKGNETTTNTIYEVYGDYLITKGTSADDIEGNVALPAVRFLQINCNFDNKYVCGWVQNALVDCSTAPKGSIVKKWEIGVMALLEVWRAAARAISTTTQEAVLGSLPLFDSAFSKADCIVHRIDAAILLSSLPNKPLPLTETEGAFGLWYSTKSNEAYVEGTIRYNNRVCLLFQNKMHTTLKKDDFVAAMVKLAKKEALLQRKNTSTKYVSVLITTGATVPSLNAWINKYSTNEWPRNYVIVTKEAVQALIQPFGPGVLQSMLSTLPK